MKCCERDHNEDGNCDIHSSPGVFRNPQFNEIEKAYQQTMSGKDEPSVVWIDKEVADALEGTSKLFAEDSK
jgi:hypothetical protein